MAKERVAIKLKFPSRQAGQILYVDPDELGQYEPFLDRSWTPDENKIDFFSQGEQGVFSVTNDESTIGNSAAQVTGQSKPPETKAKGDETQEIKKQVGDSANKAGTLPKTPGKNVGILATMGSLTTVDKNAIIGLARQWKNKLAPFLPASITQIATAVIENQQAKVDFLENFRFNTSAVSTYASFVSLYEKAQADPMRLVKRDKILSYLGRKLDFPALFSVTSRDTKLLTKTAFASVLEDQADRLASVATSDSAADIQKIRDSIALHNSADNERKIEELVYSSDHFILQSVSRSDNEKYQVVNTFGEPVVIFYDRNIRIYGFNMVLPNAQNVRWRDEFHQAYDKYLRGTAIAENNYRLILTFDEIMLEGALLNLSINQSANDPMSTTASFQMFVEKETLLQKDLVRPFNKEEENKLVDPNVMPEQRWGGRTSR